MTGNELEWDDYVQLVFTRESEQIYWYIFNIFSWRTLDSNTLAQVARINFSRLDLNSLVQNIFKNVFGLSVGELEIVLLIFWEILSCS